MNIVAVPHLALLLMVFAAAIVLATQAVGKRFGDRGLVVFWLVASAALAAGERAWFVSVMPGTVGGWRHFLIPFLFLLVEIGTVAAYIAWSTRRGEHGRRQALLALAAFTVALIPALIVALIPSMLQAG
jgi:hypothetical protein